MLHHAEVHSAQVPSAQVHSSQGNCALFHHALAHRSWIGAVTPRAMFEGIVRSLMLGTLQISPMFTQTWSPCPHHHWPLDGTIILGILTS